MQYHRPIMWKTLPHQSNMVADVHVFKHPAVAPPPTEIRGTRVRIYNGRIIGTERDVALLQRRPSTSSSNKWVYRTTLGQSKITRVQAARPAEEAAKKYNVEQPTRKRKRGAHNIDTDNQSVNKKAARRAVMRSRKCQFCSCYAPIQCANTKCCKKCCHAKKRLEVHVECVFHATKK